VRESHPPHLFFTGRLSEGEAYLSDFIEFKMPLTAIKSPQRLRLAPYFVIEQAGEYVVADGTASFEVNGPKNELPPSITAVSSVANSCVATSTWGTLTVTTRTTPETETGTAVSQPSGGLFTTENQSILGIAFIVISIAVLYLRKR
jgi:hypothetical protein